MNAERLLRKEDRRLLRGVGRFVDDLDRPGQLWLRMVRSPVAHGLLRAIDTAAAAGSDGVVRVVTAADLPGDPHIPVRLPVQGVDLSPFLQPVLARDRVRYVGEPIAAVLAEDPYAAEDAAELVDVEIDELPPVLDAQLAAGAGALPLFEAGNVAADFTFCYGDVDAAFAHADEVVELDLDIGRHSAVPMEARGLLAEYDQATGVLSIFGWTKVPVFNRDVLAELLGMDEMLVHGHSGDAGGGFGVRGEFYPEDFLVPWLARSVGRPVRWIEDRSEHLVATNHSRQQAHRIAAAFDRFGRLLALRDEVHHDNGAYCRTHGIIVAELTLAMLPGPYRVPAYSGRIVVGLTNKTPCGTYRAPGRFEGTTAREQLLDVAADRLGIDRVELRRRNLLQRHELPHTRPLNTLGTDVVLDAADYPGLLDQAIAEIDRLGYPAQLHQARTQGRLAGLGVAVFLEKSGLGPYETADVIVSTTGSVHVYTGGTSFGQGLETVLAQLSADALGVDPGAVTVIGGDTDRQPHGLGTWASRTTVLAGNAVDAAATMVRHRAIEVAARVLGVSPDKLQCRDGQVSMIDVADVRISLSDLACACRAGSDYLEPGEPAGLSARYRFEVDHMTYPYGVHVALVEIDPGTASVRVLRYLVAYEVGRAINRTLVAGQLVGGVAQGIGGALLEEFRYDEAGQPQAVTFLDYLLPTAAEVPPIDVLVVEDMPSPGNPLGVKGAGEGGVSGCGAAIANAVRDALGLTGGIGALPLTPERVGSLLANRAERPVGRR